MALEGAGRSDKHGNRYEIRWVIYQLLKVIEEEIDSVTLEALGDDEQGVDVWIRHKNGICEGQQCKCRNKSKDNWTVGSLNSHDILKKWKIQLDRKPNINVSLVSPISFVKLEDLVGRANNTSKNPYDFIDVQIKKSSKEFYGFYNDYCSGMNLNPENANDLVKSIDYLKRTKYIQIPDTSLTEFINNQMKYLFAEELTIVYDSFVSLIVDKNILAKEIDNTYLQKFLNEKNIKLKNLSNDKRILPRIIELNEEYSSSFLPINNELIEREEFSFSKDLINEGKSILIHGKAGSGKSGYTEYIINYCNENLIPYIAIKLDKRVPQDNAEAWGKRLGFSSSIVHCLHSISKNTNAVIILDQLDALRWTQAHSRDSLEVCTELINQVKQLNCEREKKISIVFVCRTYDLENDRNIKILFNNTDDIYKIIWEKVKVGEFGDDLVKSIVGKPYEGLSNRLKSVLKIPSNLYIWQQLDKNESYNDCSTSSNLIAKWWKQICEKCSLNYIDEQLIISIKEEVVNILNKLGRISVSKKILNVSENGLNYLSSNGFLTVQGDIVSFSHQSILDCFLAEDMMKRYYNGESIIEIIGDLDQQTPNRRYQIQMFMQELVDYNIKDFLSVGREMLSSDKLRYYIKYVFFEVLNQIDKIDDLIKNFVVEFCKDKKYATHVINNVIAGRKHYIKAIQEKGILDDWMQNSETKNITINLLTSIASELDVDDIDFIKKYAFKSEEDDKKLFRIFLRDINEGIDEAFELRMEYYNKYPTWSNDYIDFKAMLKKCEIRTIRVLEFWLKNSENKKTQGLYRYEEQLLDGTEDIFINHAEEVINLLLKHVPKDTEKYSFSNWISREYNQGIERTCIQILKKANRAIISQNPALFIEKYTEYMGKGYLIFNELILDALLELPSDYSDFVIKYLCGNFDKNIFDNSSQYDNELDYVKKVIEKHSKTCDNNSYFLLEDTIIKYIHPCAKDYYKNRIKHNKNDKVNKVYWSFWGDLQYELIPCLPVERVSKRVRDLLLVLKRKFGNDEDCMYKKLSGHGGWVRSPISDKKLNDNQWHKIITNLNLGHRGDGRYSSKEVSGGVISNSAEDFARDFGNTVSEEPERMIKLVLECDKQINDVFIDSLFSGVALSEKIDNIPIKVLESMFLKYKYDYESYRASSICEIIRKKEDCNWSIRTLEMLKDIAINHNNPKIDKPNVSTNDDKEVKTFDMLESNAINCVRGQSAEAIGHLLWKNYKLFNFFKSTIIQLLNDENPIVSYASLYALWPSYNIERDWATKKILKLYERDYRFAGFHDTRGMLHRMYPKYKDRVLKIINKCYKSDDKRLIEVGAFCIVEMYMLKNEFVNEIMSVNKMNKDQSNSIIQMAITYFDINEYNLIAKGIISNFRKSKLDLENSFSRLFYGKMINLDRDKAFLIDIMNSDLNRTIFHSFVYYLEEESTSIISYSDIILTSCEYLLKNYGKNDYNDWWVSDGLSKLIISLYDETCNSDDPTLNIISTKCLEIWDIMFEKQIGVVRKLSQLMLNR